MLHSYLLLLVVHLIECLSIEYYLTVGKKIIRAKHDMKTHIFFLSLQNTDKLSMGAIVR